MMVTIVQQAAETLPEHGAMPISCQVESHSGVQLGVAGLGGWTVTEGGGRPTVTERLRRRHNRPEVSATLVEIHAWVSPW